MCKKGTNEIYAMKVLRKSCIEKKHQIEHTKTERSILGKVTHPFIVNLRYAFQTVCFHPELRCLLARQALFRDGLLLWR